MPLPKKPRRHGRRKQAKTPILQRPQDHRPSDRRVRFVWAMTSAACARVISSVAFQFGRRAGGRRMVRSVQQHPLSPGAIGPLRRCIRVRFGGLRIAESEDVLLVFEPCRYPMVCFRRARLSRHPSTYTRHPDPVRRQLPQHRHSADFRSLVVQAGPISNLVSLEPNIVWVQLRRLRGPASGMRENPAAGSRGRGGKWLD
jgi:hypothetical protein